VIPVCPANLVLVPSAPCSNGGVGVIVSGGRTVYRGLLLKADKHFSHRYQMQASYALQAQDGINGIYNNNNWFQYWGPQAPRSILNISGIVDLPWKFQFSFISSYTSRGPFQPIIPSVDLTGSGVNGFPLPGMGSSLFNLGLGQADLVKLVNQYNQTYAGKPGPHTGQVFPTLTLPANYGLGHNFNSQDIRLTKLFKWHDRYELQVFGECFNLLNISNLTGYSSTCPILDSDRRPAAQAGHSAPADRAFQVGSRFSF